MYGSFYDGDCNTIVSFQSGPSHSHLFLSHEPIISDSITDLKRFCATYKAISLTKVGLRFPWPRQPPSSISNIPLGIHHSFSFP